MNKINHTIQNGNALDLIKLIPDNSIDCIITDPPYFIDGMGSDWNNDLLIKKESKSKVIGSLPVGMKFDRNQGTEFQKFIGDISKEAFRVLKPGSFYISFSQARLYHRMAVAIEDCGFEIRDMLGWVYEGQAKAFSQDHFVKKSKIYTEAEKREILINLAGRKTPQLKPCIEPMTLAQKPKVGTYVENWINFQTGLIDTNASLDGKFPGNLMNVKKPTKKEKGESNIHLTVKPIELIEHLVKLFTTEDQTILDPFTGSGSHALACLRAKRNFIGFEIEEKYVKIANNRINNLIKSQVEKI